MDDFFHMPFRVPSFKSDLGPLFFQSPLKDFCTTALSNASILKNQKYVQSPKFVVKLRYK